MMHDERDHQHVPNGFRENKLFRQCAMLPSCSLYGCILIQFVSLPLLYVWGHSLCACPLGKTVRLGLVRRHCSVSKLPWQCRRSLFHCLFPSLVSRCEGGGGGGHRDTRSCVPLCCPLFNCSSHIDHLPHSCHLQSHFLSSIRVQCSKSDLWSVCWLTYRIKRMLLNKAGL